MPPRIDNTKKAAISDAPDTKTTKKSLVLKVRLTLGDYVVKEEYVALYLGQKL